MEMLYTLLLLKGWQIFVHAKGFAYKIIYVFILIHVFCYENERKRKDKGRQGTKHHVWNEDSENTFPLEKAVKGKKKKKIIVLAALLRLPHLPREGLQESKEVVLFTGRWDQDCSWLLVEGMCEVYHCFADVRDGKSGQGEVHGLRETR